MASSFGVSDRLDALAQGDALRKYMVFNEEVKEALALKKPIVALESTVLSHGLPYPENLGLAKSMEDIVRRGGCVPCTIALLDGRIHYGLTDREIERLALVGKKTKSSESNTSPSGVPEVELSREKIHKASVRDLAWILSKKQSGATTVAATSFLANLLKIRVFATGGIGGVHRDGHITMDVSADLVEMSRSEVVVVCAGAKSILDIGRTLEYLETLGVPVIGYNTDEFPAFFTRTSGIQCPMRLDSAEEIAKLMKSSLDCHIGRGLLVAVPIHPKDEADALIVEKAIQQSLKEAEAQKITGREITPFILGRVATLTTGHSLKANIALLQQNASVAAQIAFELAKAENASIEPSSSTCHTKKSCCPTTSSSASSSSSSSSSLSSSYSSGCSFSEGSPHQSCHFGTSGCHPSINSSSVSSRYEENCPFKRYRHGHGLASSGGHECHGSYFSSSSSCSSPSPVATLVVERKVYRAIQCPSTGQFGCHCGSGKTKKEICKRAPSSSPSNNQIQQVTPIWREMAKPSKGPVWVIGGIAVDVLGVPKSNNMSDNPSSSSSEPQLDGLSIPGQVSLSAGGVGRNIAECLSKFGVSSGLISALGGQSPNPSGLLIPSSSSSLLSSSDSSTSSSPSAKRGGLKADFFGSFLIQDCKEKDISLLHMLVPNQRTAVFSALSHPDGRFRGGVAHMGVLDFVSPNLIHNLSPRLSSAKFLVVDANVPVATIDAVLDVAEKYGVPVMFEPTSAAKAPKIAQVRKLNRLSFIKPNLTELFAIANALKSVSGASSSSSSPPPPPSSHHPHDASFNPSQEEIDTCLSILLSSGIQTVLLTMGAKGVKVARMEGSSTVSSNSRLLIESFPAETPLPLVDVNGAGDSFASGFIFGFMSGLSLQQSVKLGLRSARLTCETEKSVSPHLGSSLLMDFATSASSL